MVEPWRPAWTHAAIPSASPVRFTLVQSAGAGDQFTRLYLCVTPIGAPTPGSFSYNSPNDPRSFGTWARREDLRRIAK